MALQRAALTSLALAVLISAAALAQPARSEVLKASDNGFAIKLTLLSGAPPAIAYRSLLRVGDWWSDDHSWSGKAANMSLKANPGGCWCETIPEGGFVEHMRVIAVMPGQEVRLAGGLGPLQFSGASGHMSWKIEPAEHGSRITWTYQIGGFSEGGLAPLAPMVDKVLDEQLTRLGHYISR